MKKISICGQIIPEHWRGENEVTEQDVTEQLAGAAPGEDAEICINSPGGDVFTAIAIFNHIREFAKMHACTVVMQGIVGSAASYIALAAKAGNPASKIKAYDNSIFFIHNAQAHASGDWHEMERMADLAKSISDLICNSAYAKVSSDSVEAIHAAMDAETYYFGEEIKAHGYADEIEGAPDEEGAKADRGAMVAQARAQYENCMSRLRQWMDKSDANRQLAARLSASFLASMAKPTRVAQTTQSIQTEDSMDITELKAKYPEAELYYIVGEDSLAGLPRWRAYDELVREVKFVAYPRTFESSTEIRRRLAAGEDVARFFPPGYHAAAESEKSAMKNAT